MAYCSTADVRAITNLTTSEISNSEISDLISHATYELNSDIGQTHTLKLGIGGFVGDFDGSNDTFTFRNSPIGDLDNDGSVGTGDIKIWRKLSNEDHWTVWSDAISSIDDYERGKFTFASAPLTTYNYLVKYVWFPIPYDDKRITKACTELTSYLCFLKVNLKDVSSYRIGKVSVSKTARHPGLSNFYERYKNTLNRIRGQTIIARVDWEMAGKMAEELVENIDASMPQIV